MKISEMLSFNGYRKTKDSFDWGAEAHYKKTITLTDKVAYDLIIGEYMYSKSGQEDIYLYNSYVDVFAGKEKIISIKQHNIELNTLQDIKLCEQKYAGLVENIRHVLA